MSPSISTSFLSHISDFPTVKVKEVLTTQNVTQLTETSYLYDLGHNFAGKYKQYRK